ncbi:MAG: methyltransferase family protein [Candidatus Acidiferrales bacterium]
MKLFLKVLLFILLVPGSATVWIPYFLLPRSPTFDLGSLRWLGLVPLLVGAAVLLRCIWEFAARGRGTPAPVDPPKTLVVSGLYRYVRNPMYVGVLLTLIGEALVLGWWSLVAYPLLFAPFFHLYVVFYEERTLRRKFGAAYDDYRRAVPRWIPRLKPPPHLR